MCACVWGLRPSDPLFNQGISWALSPCVWPGSSPEEQAALPVPHTAPWRPSVDKAGLHPAHSLTYLLPPSSWHSPSLSLSLIAFSFDAHYLQLTHTPSRSCSLGMLTHRHASLQLWWPLCGTVFSVCVVVCGLISNYCIFGLRSFFTVRLPDW